MGEATSTGLGIIQRAVERIDVVLRGHDDEWKDMGEDEGSVGITQGTDVRYPTVTGDGAGGRPSLPRTAYQSQLVDAFLRSPGNEVVFLPTGFGQDVVVDAIIEAMVNQHPDKHVVLCVVRPAQALSHAARLSAALPNVPVGSYAGGDFLYDFPAEFKKNKVLVFTAGLLMRLTKLGTYNLSSASLLVLHDATSAVKNHPMNTLLREYYWKGQKGDEISIERPRVLGVVLPQVLQINRPFDKLRQLVRKLCHSAQAGAIVPTGMALESLAVRLHKGHLVVHAYEHTDLEQELLMALQAHTLLIWDTLHEFGLNHFGRLVHFPSQAANGSHGPHGSTSPATPVIQNQLAIVDVGDSHATPKALNRNHAQQGPTTTKASTPTASQATLNSAESMMPDPNDPAHHDWLQVELMVEHSIKCSNSLMSNKDAVNQDSEHKRSEVALKVMSHVLRCSRAIRVAMEAGIDAALRMVQPALMEFQQDMQAEKQKHSSATSSGGPLSPTSLTSVDEELCTKVEEAISLSPLIAWLSAEDENVVADVANASRQNSRLQALCKLLSDIRNAPQAQGPASPQAHRIENIVIVTSIKVVSLLQKQLLEDSAVSEAVKRWKQDSSADTGKPHGLRTIHLMTPDEAQGQEGRNFLCHGASHVIWFSAANVLAALAPDIDSTALKVLYGVCAATYDVDGDLEFVPGPQCHVLATGAQAAAWIDVCRADQLLLAAMQLIQLGDAALEAYICQLMADNNNNESRDTAAAAAAAGDAAAHSLMPISRASVLHTLCVGLCGRPPTFKPVSRHPHSPIHQSRVPSKSHPVKETDGSGEPELVVKVTLPDEMVIPGSMSWPPLPLSPGSDAIVFQGRPASSETEARDNAAEAALRVLALRGLVGAYWQTRTVLGMKSSQTATNGAAWNAQDAVGAISSPFQHPYQQQQQQQLQQQQQQQQQQQKLSTTSVEFGNRNTTVMSPFVDAMLQGKALGMDGGGPKPARPPDEHLICDVCGIMTTSEGHMQEHLDGRRHKKNLERVLLQQKLSSPSKRKTDTNGADKDDEKDAFLSEPARQSQQLTSWPTLERLPSTLSDTFLRRSTSIHRATSGGIPDGFPCVRVGDVVLPSSMDLRAFLDEMQNAGELPDSASVFSSPSPSPSPSPSVRGVGSSEEGGPATMSSPARQNSARGGGGTDGNSGHPRRSTRRGGFGNRFTSAPSLTRPSQQMQMQMQIQNAPLGGGLDGGGMVLPNAGSGYADQFQGLHWSAYPQQASTSLLHMQQYHMQQLAQQQYLGGLGHQYPHHGVPVPYGGEYSHMPMGSLANARSQGPMGPMMGGAMMGYYYGNYPEHYNGHLPR